MIFKWRYGEDGGPDTLMLGNKDVGVVYRTETGLWRVICHLPQSARNGSAFIQDFAYPGQARGTLEIVCATWVSAAALWRVDAQATMTENVNKD